MADSRLLKRARWAGWILGSTMVAAFVVYLFVLLVKNSKDSNDYTADSTGSRVTDSLKFVVFVSSHPYTLPY